MPDWSNVPKSDRPLRVVERAEIIFDNGVRELAYVVGRRGGTGYYNNVAIERGGELVLPDDLIMDFEITRVTYVPLRPIVE